ncbi:tetratricopeptide repeat protein [Actinosynnema sp. NPDC020468]|uniref:tetratricopeptide repeat protein n=1 Tax=Actinosynnema sp. NPDC020468 TaxID=3154488 RepID=UPI0033EE9E86
MDVEDAAFGAHPEAAVGSALTSPDPRSRWLAAVVLGAQGHYAAAATALTHLLAAPAPYASLAASTLASHHRQLGDHATARTLDARALRESSGPAPAVLRSGAAGHAFAEARADALLGLAADAVGRGRLDEARRLHARVRPTTWRSEVRHRWVGAEIHLAGGHAERAVPEAEAAAEVSRAAGGTRHLLKSDLVLGTALVVWGTPESVARGVDLLLCDLNHINRRGLISLSWPTAHVLSGVVTFRNTAEGENLAKIAATALSCVLRRADHRSRRAASASPWVPTALLRSGEPPNADPGANFLTD